MKHKFIILQRLIHHYPVRSGIAAFIGVAVAIQLLYPVDRLVPFASIDSVSVGGKTTADALSILNKKTESLSIPVRLAKKTTAYAQVGPSDIGLSIDNGDRINQASYPLFMRLIPTSIVWLGLLPHTQPPHYSYNSASAERFLSSKLGDCHLSAQNANIQLKNKTLQVVPAKNGGTCDKQTALKVLGSLTPTITKPGEIRIDAVITEPAVSTKSADATKSKLLQDTKNGLTLNVKDSSVVISQSEILSWLSFTVSGSTLVPTFNQQLAGSYLTKEVASKVETAAGTTKVTTTDFTETARQPGVPGTTIDTDKTSQALLAVVTGQKQEASVAIKEVVPKTMYTRQYSKTITGISALVQQYGQDHPGTYGVSYFKLDNSGQAEANGSQVFTTASTYKLFVAYSTLKRIDAGQWHWDDANIASGRNLATCFDDMIIKSDNACAESLLNKVGIPTINQEITGLGLGNSGFKSDGPKSTPNDLRTFLVKLYRNELGLKPESANKLLSVMKQQVYRTGIPAGSNGTVADKVGFLNGLLHDAAIVYSPKGDYVLIIMTDGSSWANIADITRQIEQLR